MQSHSLQIDGVQYCTHGPRLVHIIVKHPISRRECMRDGSPGAVKRILDPVPMVKAAKSDFEIRTSQVLAPREGEMGLGGPFVKCSGHGGLGI
ncbi:hypothetical protein RHGRI_022936 [Rhododendron griersonianum]|uniref:Uncharacterized protein n=1 Tax=Rhododendron griersonianum TaxID=479676 RepID=A0AAV6J1F3_9ERIC|nr:hypothetical protein RHGRI_022936 [Rhododendron griersonianum]